MTLVQSSSSGRAAPSRPRRRASRSDPGPVQAAVAPLLAAHGYRDAHELRRAYAVAERMHRGQLRKSGAPYITHPLAVAMILAGLGLDTTTLVAALLHDTVEDTPYTLGEVRADFGEEVAVLVDGVTKLDGERWGDRREAETFRKIVLAAAADLRVLVIKLADRLHNLRTLGFQPPHKRERIARASLELLVPFAERLGIHVLRQEMDDLAFKVRDPEAHAGTGAALAAALRVADGTFGPAAARLRGTLAEHHLRGEVAVRPRHLYALHEELDGDVAGLRPHEAARLLVVVDGDESDCYIALGAVHAAMHPIPGRVKDFIALPKFNMYQSLHTRVIGPAGDPLNVIIRTRAMHPVAEHGIIAHLRETGDPAGTMAGRRDLAWLSRLLAWQSDAPSAQFLDSLRADLTSGHVAAFTPTGEIVTLPVGATALDFAYTLSPETGEHCIGVLINGRPARLATEVRSGNVIEVLTDPQAHPTDDWLGFATTPQARVHIQRRLSHDSAEEASRAGRDRLDRALAERGTDLLAAETHGESLAIARDLGFDEVDRLYAALDDGSVALDDLLPRFLPPG
ncbi:bifunctional (p)ppGpp synthetase/guanosine-3',5'-bis(diphosphate) 3'-pyrophosphohydrolase [Actinomadura craniellae]|uniref:Bifunctional (P)ppGpp synthetase/guanosine-3',5'-bis(Diphosphate) 3'-pyrophosphohydrolase n=1 Tax=Actinomadura craniellae TaxID=2231787 RepID=A0A365GYB9_9ACTN|nr:HD domain-containing protein [Actinomadura craniellae]RAY10923.1 bifunctional (p)ppGpp synthetase/guanosine-3',5'-bis(diphosphate) 3'-pyrophosphohydrolase [Actinomadura craniellae]